MTNNIEIINCGNRVFFSNIRHDMFCEHRLPTHGLMMVRSGHVIIETADEHIEVNEGECCFWHRNCTGRMKKCSDGDTPFSSIAICLDTACLKSYFADRLSGRRLPRKILPIYSPAVTLPRNIKTESLFMMLTPYADQRVEPDEETIVNVQRAAIRCLLDIDERMYPTLFDFHEDWKINLSEFMEKHFMEDLSIDEYASYTGRSLATFKRDFAKISSLTPQKWLIERRLELSSRLLRETGVKASTVYEEVGFKNRTHFSGLFKRRYGLSPAAYQQQYSENEKNDSSRIGGIGNYNVQHERKNERYETHTRMGQDLPRQRKGRAQ